MNTFQGLKQTKICKLSDYLSSQTKIDSIVITNYTLFSMLAGCIDRRDNVRDCWDLGNADNIVRQKMQLTKNIKMGQNIPVIWIII